VIAKIRIEECHAGGGAESVLKKAEWSEFVCQRSGNSLVLRRSKVLTVKIKGSTAKIGVLPKTLYVDKGASRGRLRYHRLHGRRNPSKNVKLGGFLKSREKKASISGLLGGERASRKCFQVLGEKLDEFF